MEHFSVEVTTSTKHKLCWCSHTCTRVRVKILWVENFVTPGLATKIAKLAPHGNNLLYGINIYECLLSHKGNNIKPLKMMFVLSVREDPGC